MNLQISYNWIREYVRTRLSPEEFAARLSLSGPSVDRWRACGESLDGVVVGEILEFRKHANADKLHVAKVDVGKKQPIQLIFGQMVVMHAGDKVPVAVAPTTLPGARKVEKAKIRGEISEGMLCLDQELGLLKEGVSIRYFDASVPNGTPIMQALELDDTIFEIEVTSNRPDAFSAVGIAREASAILGAPFLWKPITPTPYTLPPNERAQSGVHSQIVERGREATSEAKLHPTPLDIRIEAPKLCSRYQAAVVTGVQVKPSPWWIEKRLLASGIRPISNIVDITNYVMLEQGQPMHAFDADTLRTENREKRTEIVVRTARQGEKIKALDGNEYRLDPSMLVIADAQRPIAIAGVMGGEDTGVTKDTTTIIFESANFDPVSVRHTARTLKLYSDSSLRFEKGLSTESTTSAIARAVELACEIAGGTSASPLLDKRAKSYRAPVFPWDPKATARAIGVEIPLTKMKTMLSSLGFTVKSSGKKFRVTVPYWRDHDIEASQDLDEEVARLYGFHNVPSKLPEGPLADWPAQSELAWEDRLRETFSGAGFTETYSNSFVSRHLLELAGCDLPVLAVQNPLSEDLAVMRPALYPSLLAIVQENEPREPRGAIFEIAKSYTPRPGDLPIETLKLAGAVWSEASDGGQFYRVKGMLEYVRRRWNLAMTVTETVTEKMMNAILHSGRRMGIAGVSGSFGEVHPTIIEHFGIKRRVAIFEINLMELVSHAGSMHYEPLPQLPVVRRDISFIIPRRTTYDAVVAVLQGTMFLRSFELFDVYRGKGIGEGEKSLALHLEFADPARTLTNEEVDRMFGKLATDLKHKFGAEVRSE